MSDIILRTEELRKSFGRKEVVKGVSFSMKAGEVVGLLGLNGAGKTTTFYMIVGFIKPNGGEIFLREENMTRLPMYRRALAGISYLPQETSVFTKLTVEKNIMAILETRKDLNPEEKREKLETLLEEFGLKDKRFQKAITLSGGERRRTEIARSLAIEPKFLLLDEPFAGIDLKTVGELKKIITRLSEQGVGILITDHNIYDTFEITRRAMIMNQGIIAFEGTPRELADNPEVRRIFLGEDFRMLNP
ncbi:MAG: LPS export ABC transporter ATP-binding protein [Spirochaetales bacterium]|jgi:lipopolysaccharide export system ATP-binding protein|nr:LPS export ABC transporter ATP-binding protein [Spirochaetales bacterium]